MNSQHIVPVKITAGIITVSTTRTPDTDTSGMRIHEIFDSSKIPVVYYEIVPDRIGQIRDQIFKAEKVANCIVLNGGTGLTHDDCTIEAISPLLDKKIDGFGEMFRSHSVREIGTSAMLSRAVAGIRNGRAVFCIPGSTKAVTLAMNELIIPEITHILSHANR